jgi:hypothetical protein
MSDCDGSHTFLNISVRVDFCLQEQTEDLRSALEDKARKSGGAGGKSRGTRKMKRGQAKTISDLPKLNT